VATQVSLHNSALINMDVDPTGGFKKLNFLLQSPPFPPETFGNLLLLCVGWAGWPLKTSACASSALELQRCAADKKGAGEGGRAGPWHAWPAYSC